MYLSSPGDFCCYLRFYKKVDFFFLGAGSHNVSLVDRKLGKFLPKCVSSWRPKSELKCSHLTNTQTHTHTYTYTLFLPVLYHKCTIII